MRRSGAWVGTWEAAPQLTEERNLPPAPGLNGTTLRQVIHVSLGGSRFRLRLSNEFGDGPIVVTSARVARSLGRDSIAPASDMPLRFAGASSTRIEPGQAVLSEPFDIALAPLSDLTITLFIASMPKAVTGHPGLAHDLVSSRRGIMCRSRRCRTPATTEHWYVISGLEVIDDGSRGGGRRPRQFDRRRPRLGHGQERSLAGQRRAATA